MGGKGMNKLREPELAGAGTKAWKVALVPQSPEQEAKLAAWVVEGPFHPMWSRWLLSVIHLRDIPGVPPASKDGPTMTHEFAILSLNPEQPVDLDLPDLHTLHLPDAVIQFKATDEEAVEVLTRAVQQIVDKKASPDSDFQMYWQKHFVGPTLEDIRKPKGR
jgi:hypothetical protein